MPPFYAHFLGYLIMKIRPSPVIYLFIEDYRMDMVRSLMEHASELNFECLTFIYQTFEAEENGSN